jgi:long-subunit acyl-CoA synthetase (AMP-forming)
LHRDFSLFYGDLGPTMKLRRLIVSKSFEKEIENLYKDDVGND